MRKMWAYRYSLISYLLILCELFVAFGLTSSWYLGPALAPDSDSVRRLGVLCLVLGFGSSGFATAAVLRERVKGPAVTAAVLSGSAFLICGLRFAV